MDPKNLVDVRAEELLALELDVGVVVGLRARDRDLSAEFNPGDGEDAATVGRGKGANVLLVVVHKSEFALSNVVNGDLWTNMYVYM